MISEVRSNFDFGKLKFNMKKIIKETFEDLSKESVELAKKKIDSGLKPLKKSTIELRQQRGIGGTKPLYETGRLYNSIKPIKGGFSMNKYGWYQHSGFTAMNVPVRKNKQNKPSFIRGLWIRKDVDARPFALPDENELAKNLKEVYSKMRRALKGNIVTKFK